MRFIGRREGVRDELQKRMDWAEQETAGNDRITLFVAFNYGGRAEILDAAEASRAATRRNSGAGLYAPEMHDPDLLIRTSGEQRLSNYLLWQCAYSEFVFRDELWPDFSREAFEAALRHLRGAAAALRSQMTPMDQASIRRPSDFGADARGRSREEPPIPSWTRPRSRSEAPTRGAGRPTEQPRRARRRRLAQLRCRSETARRVLWAIPWVIFAIFIVAVGGFALHRRHDRARHARAARAFRMTEQAAAARAPGLLGVWPAMVLAAHYGDRLPHPARLRLPASP